MDHARGAPNKNGKRTTLRPAWLSWPLPDSCTFDIADNGHAQTFARVARALGLDDEDWASGIVDDALGKADGVVRALVDHDAGAAPHTRVKAPPRGKR